MSSSSRQHWQEDNKHYTFNQYAFYLIFLGVVIAGLFIGYLILMRGRDIPVTHLVSITSQPGGELPVIPFQNEDSTALRTSFENYAGYEFNDIASFEQNVIKQLMSDCDQKNQDIDTVIIWLSAIGYGQDGEPKILGSDPGQAIPLETLVNQLAELKAQSVILLLDCGHAYVDPDAYVNKSVDFDFNPFPRVVMEAFADLPTDGKVQVLINGLRGERPMYSTTRRRSLFGLAIESSFKQDDEIFWSSKKLATDLDKFCLSHGGTTTPHLKWLGKDAADIEFRRPIVVGTEEEVDPDEEQDPDKIEITADASKITSEMNKTWSAYQRTRDKFVVPPTSVDPDNWRLITQRLIAFAADELQSDVSLLEFTTACNKIRLEIQDMEEILRDKAERVREKLKLIRDPVVETESKLVLEKRQVAHAIIRFHDLEQRLPHYVAIADSLSWIFPTNDGVEQLVINTGQLIELVGETNKQTDFSSVLQKSDPSLDQLDGINIASDRLFRSEERLLKKLNYVCRYVVNDTQGFQREMAVEALLRMPFLETEKPDETSPGYANEDRLWSREELQETLAINPMNTFPQIEISDREQASAKRIENFRKFISNVASPENPNPTSLRLQSFSSRLSASKFDINKFEVRDRTPQIWVKANRRDDLGNGENYVELTPTELDLGLVVKHTQVLVNCEIIQSEKYFAFAGADNGSSKFVFTGNPKLVALQDSLEINPQCKLNVSIVDKTNASKEYDNFTIPLRLPSKNLIELTVVVGGNEHVFRKDALGDPIRPFANHKDLCNFSVRNNWHRPRTGTVSLYACESPVSATMVGKIDNEVKQQTLRLLDVNSLPMVATANFELPGAVAGQSIKPVKLVWQNPPGVEEGPVIAVDHGLLCIVNHEDAGKGWHYWIPVFPFEKPVVSILPDVTSDDLTLIVNRKEFCPAEMSVSIHWRFTGDQINGGKEILAAGNNTLEIPVAKNVSQLLNKNGSFLYVDVDDWPRRYVFEFNGRTFNTVSPNDAAVSVRIGKKDDEPPKVPVLIELPSTGDILKYGTRSDDDTVTINLAVNVPSDSEAFLFSRAEDHISLFETGGANQNLYYPRQISNTVQLVPKSGIMLESRVSDHELTFEDVGSRFQLSPTLHLAQRELRLRGQNQIQIQFDQLAPKISDIRVATSAPIYSRNPVRIRVDASDGEGVGIDWNKSVWIFLSERNGSLRDLTSGNPYPSKRVDASTYEIEAPEEIGTYTVGAKVADRVGNEDQSVGSNRVKFEVIKKPIVVQKKPTVVEPKIFTHNLIVTVQADDLSNVTDPEIEIKPPDASPEFQRGKYVFKKLKGDVQYTITAKAKIKRGVAKGDELSATLRYKFPKDAEDSLTISNSMKLKR